MAGIMRKFEVFVRITLLVVFVAYSLVPAGAQAQSFSAPDAASSPGFKGSGVKLLRHFFSSRADLQENTPTPTGAPTSELSTTPTPTIEITEQNIEEIVTPSVTTEATSTATPIPTETQTPNTPAVAPNLSLKFSTNPEQAQPGQEVVFSVSVVNTGQSAVDGIQFSNTLPEIFSYIDTKSKGVSFDSQTRELVWNNGNKDGAVLESGKSITFEYTVQVGSQVSDAQIVDTVNLTANGLDQPLTAETTLTLPGTDNSLTMIDTKGGAALGLGGRVTVELPAKSVDTEAGLAIQDLSQEQALSSTSDQQQPLLVFKLGLSEPRPEEAQLLTPTKTPVLTPNEESISQETDRIIPFQAVEAKFEKPVEVTVSFDGLADLATLGADSAPFLATLDEKSGTWIRVPLKNVDREANTITAEVTHFSIWGAGVGSATPQTGANVLLYDNPYPDLFTGRAHFSLPIWTPPGRNGMAPALALSYSSNIANGILGDVQAPWVGMGWNVDLIEIARKITNGNCAPCGNGSYGYENNFLLLINGTGYELITDGTTPGRYHTKTESFLYIQLHNDALGNNSPAATNSSGEWWEIVERDGKRWRLGSNADSEQLAAMSGYPGAATGSWVSLGYAGHATDVVALRWRADRVTDTHGNRMIIGYFEENRPVAGTSTNYDRASYLDTITYTSHTSGNPAPGYSVVFVRESRGASEVPASPNDWDNWDTYRLDRIEAKYGSTVVRSYDLSYDLRSYADDGKSWDTTVLSSVAISGGSTNDPTTTFTYIDKDNRANCGSGCQEWAYPRLATISNGWGGVATYTYGNDGRPNTSWYNWRVETLDVADGVNANPMKSTFAYSTPCYKDPSAGWCNGTNVGELVGYGQTTLTTMDFNGTTALGIAVHKFYSDEQKAGREYEVQNQNGSGTTLSQTSTTFTVSTSGLPNGGYFTFASAVDEYLLTGSLTHVYRTEYTYDTTTGNQTSEKQSDGTPTLYRETDYDYVTNTSASVWILNTLARKTLKDAGGTTLAIQEYGYDGSLPASGSPTVGELTLSRAVSGTQTIDTKYVYDAYGNVTDTRQYKNYGSTASQPSGAYLTYLIGYDTNLQTYPTSVTNPLNQAAQEDYDFGLGLPTSVTDPNNNTTTTVYDGLGRITQVKYPGFGQPNIKYTYATPPVSAPFAMKAEVWDETISAYRAAWQMQDGLGRVIQTQGPYETAGMLVLSDTSYNAQGLAFYQGLPRALTGTGGSYFIPNWGSVLHTTSSYDALGRGTSVGYADTSTETYSYFGLRTTAIDRNSHQKVQEKDAFGRLVKVEEYTGSGTYTLYATTTYEYDPRDLLTKITDAQSNQTIIGYNGFGRKDSMNDPDMGAWSYTYDVLGNLTNQADARGCGTAVTYDDLNRPTQKTYSGPGACATTPSVTYTYDSITAGNEGVGRRTGMTDGSGSTNWTYNVLGQATSEKRNIDSTNYQLDFTFDAFNRAITQNLPSGETLNYGYNAMGALSSLSGTNTYVSQIHYSASGQTTDQQLGNGLIQQDCYDTNTLRISAIRVYSGTLQSCGTNPSAPKLNLAYTYQPNGNISQIMDSTQNETIHYTYDELDRLLSASGANNKNYGYNTNGNIDNVVTTPTLTAVSLGQYHSCGLTASGGVKCWGRNDHGQLGDGTTTNRLTPVDVSGLTSGVVAIAVGGWHTCALTSSGGVKCWGYNFWGQLGNNTTIDSLTPVDVSGLTTGVATLAAGFYDTCAVTTGGAAKCWGGNGSFQLGDGTSKDRSTPVNVSGLTSGVASISTGDVHTCVVMVSSGAKCWGNNHNGQVGDGTSQLRKTPVNVSGLTSGVASISAGYFHTCAVTTSGGAKCWGGNGSGQVGNGTTTDQYSPVNVTGLTSGVAMIVAPPGNFTCAVTTNGGAKCWGDNTYGRLGDGTTTQHSTPTDVSGLTSGIARITGGLDHTCALTISGGVKCWGYNADGEFGNGTTVNSTTAVDTNFSTLNGYSYDGHAVTALSSGETYTYDADGNMTARLEGGLTYTQTFDAENRLVSVTVGGQTTQFIYDGDGNLVKKVKPDGSKTIYVGNVYEVDKTSGGAVSRTVTYYPAGNAMRINSTLYYILKDHLGSANAATDASGNVVGEMRYYATGETRLSTGNMFTDRLFTSQRQMAGLGIYQFGARFYSPKLGRFLSADSIVPQLYNPQSLNRYSYVNNNPLRYTDPTGHWLWQGEGGSGSCYSTCTTTSSSGSTSGTTSVTKSTSSGGGDGGTPTATNTPTSSPNSSTTNVSLTYLNAGISALYKPSIPTFPPSLFACEWIDCALSFASVVFSLGTFPGMPPEIYLPSLGLDIGVTLIAIGRTNAAYDQGKITQVSQYALNITGALGAIPGPFGLGLSLGNFLFTLTGRPS